MRRAIITSKAQIAALATVFGLLAAPSFAADDADPLASFAPIGAADLADLSGRQGINLSDQELTARVAGGEFDADTIKTGKIDFGSSMRGMRGISNQAINTGNNANVNAGLTVQINFY